MRRIRAVREDRENREDREDREAALTVEGAVVEEAVEVSRVGYAPITRVDAARREIELCATSEALDSFGTIFDYDASRDAFTRWIGNVREMHERRAVGSSVAVRCDDDARRVYVRARISRGAQDTWEKVLDGTLRGASIGATNVIWRRERRSLGGRPRLVNVATRYDLAELSLVDNPANPDALGVAIVRDAQPDLTLLDTLDTLDATGATGARDATGDAGAMGAGPDGDGDGDGGVDGAARVALHTAARAALSGCGCALCALALVALDAGGDGDAVVGADGDGDAPVAGENVARVMAAALRASARELSRMRVALGERMAPAEARRAPAEDASAGVAALRARVERLEAQPAPGGPAASAVARAVEKTLAAAPGVPGAAEGALTPLSALEALAGRLRDPQAQMAVAAEMIRLQQGQR